MFKSIGTNELLVIAGIVVLIFGGKKIPELVRGLADSVKEFKNAAKGSDDEKKQG